MGSKIARIFLRLLGFLALAAVYYFGKVLFLDGMYLAFWDGRLSWPMVLVFWPMWVFVVLPTALVSIFLQGLAVLVSPWFGYAEGWFRYFIFYASPIVAAALICMVVLDAQAEFFKRAKSNG